MVCRRQGDDAALVLPQGNPQMLHSLHQGMAQAHPKALGSLSSLTPVYMAVFEKQPENMERGLAEVYCHGGGAID